jgi:iron complex transport system substrate-binding protein
MRTRRLLSAATAVAAALALAGCGSSGDSDQTATEGGAAGSGSSFPVTIEHAFGETTIEEKPERVASVAWMNHEVPLALGVVPVGMSKATWGDDDGDGVLPWVEDRLTELDAETPVLFDETEGIDYEAVADTQPDVILASYSGLTQEEYDTLSKIAPTVAYPEIAWATTYQEMIRMNSEAIGMAAEGEELVEELDTEVEDTFAEHDVLAGKKVMVGYIDPNDLSQVGYYTTNDTRPGFLTEYGMENPEAVAEGSEGTDEFYKTVSAENVDALEDMDLLVIYGDDELVSTIESDPLLSKIPAVAEGHVAALPDSTPLAASANPTPLSIEWGLDDYLTLLADALGES